MKYHDPIRQRRHWAALDQLVPVQGWKCALCGLEMRRWSDQSIDHVWPLNRNGFDGLGNMVAAHRDCNTSKGDRYPTGCELIMLHSVNLALRIETVLVYSRAALTLKGSKMPKQNDEAPVIVYTLDDMSEIAKSTLLKFGGMSFNPIAAKKEMDMFAETLADVANEAVARTARESTWQKDLIDVPRADSVEIVTGPNGKVWVNVNGKCIFRAATVDVVRAELLKG